MFWLEVTHILTPGSEILIMGLVLFHFNWFYKFLSVLFFFVLQKFYESLINVLYIFYINFLSNFPSKQKAVETSLVIIQNIGHLVFQ